MNVPELVAAFYGRIWNRGDLDAVPDLISERFCFRGSLGKEMTGHDAFKDYVLSVRGPLSAYHCEILDCVTEVNKAAAKMRFSGIHSGGAFRGYPPTGKEVEWLGAAFFVLGSKIEELWVLGDLRSLDARLKANAAGNHMDPE